MRGIRKVAKHGTKELTQRDVDFFYHFRPAEVASRSGHELSAAGRRVPNALSLSGNPLAEAGRLAAPYLRFKAPERVSPERERERERAKEKRLSLF